MMRKIHMQADVAAVAGAIRAEQRIAQGSRLAIDRKELLAAKLGRGVAHVDADSLALRAGAMVQLRRGKPDRGDARLRRRADAKR